MSDQDQDEYQSGVKTTPGCCVCPCCKPVEEISVEMGKYFVRKVWFRRERYIDYVSQKFNKSSTDAEDEWMYLKAFSKPKDIAIDHAGELIVRIRVV